MALSQTEYGAFKALVHGTQHREVECQAYLKHALGLLCRDTPVREATMEQVRGHTGDADYFVIADLLNDNNDIERTVYVWELKAPQCSLFEFDANANRCRPTSDFIKAENQLLHYAEEARGSDHIRKKLGLIDADSIRLGGIIIGTDERFLKTSQEPSEVWKAKNSLKLRQKYLYRGHDIRVMVWDRILEYVRP